MWGVVKCVQIACNFTGPLRDLTGTGEQPSGKVVLRKGTREVLETPRRHPARTRTIREWQQGCSVWSIDGTLGDSTGTGDQPSGKGVLESGAGHAKETTSTVVTIGTNRKRLTGVFCLVNRVSLESTLQYGK